MSDPKLRLTRKIREIKAALRSIPLQTELTLWIHPDEKRVVFSGTLLRFDEEQEQLLLQLKIVPAALSTLDSVFVRFGGNSGVAKCRILSLNKNILTLKTSEEMILEEKRIHRRVHVPREDSKSATLEILGKLETFRVINISRSGFKLETDSEVKIRAHTAPSVFLRKLGDIPVNMECEIIRSDENTIAFRLVTDIPETDFLAYIKTPAFDRVDPEKFFQDQEYLETVQSNMQDTIERLEKLPKLQTAMKTLKVDRSGNYLRTHIDLLCYVSCSLGRILGWVTKKTLDKLILSAYLHDIRYFENPKLARIPDLSEFEKQKNTLTADECKIFLEGPIYSSLMARDSTEDSIDVERILLQQKERPDGSGFPEGLDFKQLYPLSCLFMVCHSFVDYVYETPDWSFRDFTKKAKTVFKGPYFIKILEAFDELS
jgi:HD-GYP domain-containing protein (c-di-GMP phosphodiesterase class II)